METVKAIDDKYVVVDRVHSKYLSDFIDEYGVDMECGQNSYFVLWLSDFEEYIGDYPQHKEALEVFWEELSDSGATRCVVLFWW